MYTKSSSKAAASKSRTLAAAKPGSNKQGLELLEECTFVKNCEDCRLYRYCIGEAASVEAA